MKLVVGLGNPEEKYKATRHNVGFMVIDAHASKITNYKLPITTDLPNPNFQLNKKFQSLVINYRSLILAKPQTFMNSSGTAVAKLASYYKIQTTDIYVIHDDLDIRLGEYKIQKGVGPKLHYGIESVNKALGTRQYWRIRVGVDNREKMGNGKCQPKADRPLDEKVGNFTKGEEYVLQNFTSEEKNVLNTVIEKIVKELIVVLN